MMTKRGGSHQNSTKTEKNQAGSMKIEGMATRSELRCRSGGAISSGCFVLFGLRWSVRLSALRSALIGSSSPVSRGSSSSNYILFCLARFSLLVLARLCY